MGADVVPARDVRPGDRLAGRGSPLDRTVDVVSRGGGVARIHTRGGQQLQVGWDVDVELEHRQQPAGGASL